MPGDLGRLIPPFEKSSFVVIEAPMKRGKTFAMCDWAVRSMLAGYNTMFFSLEMILSEMGMRFYQNILGECMVRRDMVDADYEITKTIELPFFDKDGEIDVRIQERKGLTKSHVVDIMSSLKERTKGAEIRYFCEPSYSVNTSIIESRILSEYKRTGFFPTVLVIDYMDVMAPEKGTYKDSKRDRTNMTWLMTRALSQKYGFLVIAGTQGSRATIKKDIEEDDASEDIRKNAHVVRKIGINKGVAPGEDPDEILRKYANRYNVIVDRHHDCDEEKHVRVLKQLDIARPYVDSRRCE